MMASEGLTLVEGTLPTSYAAAVPMDRMAEYDRITRSWSSRFGRPHFLFVADYIDAPEKKAHHLTLCGEQVYHTVCVLVKPKTRATLSYDQLAAASTAYFNQLPSEVYNPSLFQRWD